MEENLSPPRLGRWRRTVVRMQTVAQLFGALGRGPFWWLAPFALVLVLFAILLIAVQAIPAAAPLVYALF